MLIYKMRVRFPLYQWIDSFTSLEAALEWINHAHTLGAVDIETWVAYTEYRKPFNYISSSTEGY